MTRDDISGLKNFFGFLPNAEVIKFDHAPKLKLIARTHVCYRLLASSCASGAGPLRRQPVASNQQPALKPSASAPPPAYSNRSKMPARPKTAASRTRPAPRRSRLTSAWTPARAAGSGDGQ